MFKSSPWRSTAAAICLRKYDSPPPRCGSCPPPAAPPPPLPCPARPAPPPGTPSSTPRPGRFAPAPPVLRRAGSRGRALLAGGGACSTCPWGPKLTNNKAVDVGRGTDPGRESDGGPPPAAFQVPPLVGVGWCTPLLHDGCALTIADRFGKCA